MCENIIEYKNLTKVYKTGLFQKKFALKDFNLNIKKGESIGFLGHNGAGKTTSIKSLLGFVTPTTGVALVMGKTVMENPQIKKQISYIPENVKFHPYLTPSELFKFYASLNDIKISSEKIKELLKLVDLPKDIVDNQIKTFSKGMNQRLAIAMLELKESSIIILDEPTSGLDPSGRMILKNIIKNKVKNGTSVLISSHQLLDMEQLVDKVAIIKKGELLEYKTILDLRKKNKQYNIIFSGGKSEIFKQFSVYLEKEKEKISLITDSKIEANKIVEFGAKNNLTLEYFGTLPYTLEDYYMDMLGGKNNE
jgi:ABC-2 type transport system ATP-binding protein